MDRTHILMQQSEEALSRAGYNPKTDKSTDTVSTDISVYIDSTGANTSVGIGISIGLYYGNIYSVDSKIRSSIIRILAIPKLNVEFISTAMYVLSTCQSEPLTI
jgi:hypothetical protein